MTTSRTPGGYLTLRPQDGGATQTLPIVGPGGKFQVSVGRPGYRSAVWKFRAGPNKPDVYLQNAQIRDHHYSFHEGEWHHTMDSRLAAWQLFGIDERILDAWDPAEPDDFGWARAFTIWVPAEDLTHVSSDTQRSPEINWMPVPPAGHMTGIHLVIAEPDRDEVELKDVIPIAAFTLADGRFALILSSQREVSDDQRTNLNVMREQARQATAGTNLTGIDALRATLFAVDNESKGRLLFDLAYEAAS